MQSVAKLRSYDSDENNNEWSQEHFNDFLSNLEKLAVADSTFKVRFFAHSLGTRLVLRAAPLLKLTATNARMQTIDFTNLDTGLIGHTVPAKLICNMSFTGLPGPGLVLVPEQSGEVSKTSHFMSKLTKIKNSDPQIHGQVMRVVKDESVPKSKYPQKKIFVNRSNNSSRCRHDQFALLFCQTVVEAVS